LVLNGKTYKSWQTKSDMKIQTINPATEEVIAEYDSVPEEQVPHEVKDSRNIFESVWKKI